MRIFQADLVLVHQNSTRIFHDSMLPRGSKTVCPNSHTSVTYIQQDLSIEAHFQGITYHPAVM